MPIIFRNWIYNWPFHYCKCMILRYTVKQGFILSKKHIFKIFIYKISCLQNTMSQKLNHWICFYSLKFTMARLIIQSMCKMFIMQKNYIILHKSYTFLLTNNILCFTNLNKTLNHIEFRPAASVWGIY